MFGESHFLTFLLPHHMHHLFLQVVLSPLPSSSDSDPVDSGMLLLLFANGTDSLFSLQGYYDLEIVLATGSKFDFTLVQTCSSDFEGCSALKGVKGILSFYLGRIYSCLLCS